jgi:hypothetical protein
MGDSRHPPFSSGPTVEDRPDDVRPGCCFISHRSRRRGEVSVSGHARYRPARERRCIRRRAGVIGRAEPAPAWLGHNVGHPGMGQISTLLKICAAAIGRRLGLRTGSVERLNCYETLANMPTRPWPSRSESTGCARRREARTRQCRGRAGTSFPSSRAWQQVDLRHWSGEHAVGPEWITRS